MRRIKLLVVSKGQRDSIKPGHEWTSRHRNFRTGHFDYTYSEDHAGQHQRRERPKASRPRKPAPTPQTVETSNDAVADFLKDTGVVYDPERGEVTPLSAKELAGIFKRRQLDLGAARELLMEHYEDGRADMEPEELARIYQAVLQIDTLAATLQQDRLSLGRIRSHILALRGRELADFLAQLMRPPVPTHDTRKMTKRLEHMAQTGKLDLGPAPAPAKPSAPEPVQPKLFVELEAPAPGPRLIDLLGEVGPEDWRMMQFDFSQL